MKFVGITILVILVVWLCPVITIWALNTLFGLSIPTNLATWFAVLWLTAFFVQRGDK